VVVDGDVDVNGDGDEKSNSVRATADGEAC
jgi:hypothetical protein